MRLHTVLQQAKPYYESDSILGHFNTTLIHNKHWVDEVILEHPGHFSIVV